MSNATQYCPDLLWTFGPSGDDMSQFATETETVELTPGSLADLTQDVIHQMREAVLTADLDPLLMRIQDVEARDPRLARGLRHLAESFEYRKLLDLFSTGSIL